MRSGALASNWFSLLAILILHVGAERNTARHPGFKHFYIRASARAIGPTPMSASAKQLRSCFENGGAGDPPAPVGDSPTGTAAINVERTPSPIGSNRRSHSVRRVTGRNRRVACATINPFFKRALREIL